MMHPSARLLLFAMLGAVAAVLAAQPASARDYALNLDPGMCVRVDAGDSSTPAGAEWAMSTPSGAFQAGVTSFSGYSYPPTIESAHAGRVPGPDNYFFTACNVCPGGALTINFQLPDPAIGSGPQYFASPGVGDVTAACNDAGIGLSGFDFDEVAGVAGPVGVVISIGTLVFILGVPAPAQAQQLPQAGGQGPAPPAPAPLRPSLVPTPWIYPVTQGPAPPPMAGPGPRLAPTPWIGVEHRVPADALRQALPGAYPPGYPFPEGTWSKMLCVCGQLTLSPFKDGWFCTNPQCPLRTGNRTDLVSKEWFSP